MLSSERPNVLSIDFPNKKIVGSARHYSVEKLSQKIVKITGNFYLGWSGPFDEATKTINEIISDVRGTLITDEKAKSIIEKIERNRSLSLEFLFVHNSSTTGIKSFRCGGVEVQHRELGNIYVIGTGTRSMNNFLRKDPFIPFVGDVSPGPFGVDALHYALGFMLKAMSRQREFGYALDKRWGSALEIMTVKNGLEKIGNILFQTFQYKLKKDGLKFTQFGDKIFSFYYKDNFLVYTFDKKNRFKEFLIKPPHKIAEDLGLDQISRPRTVNLLVTTLMNVSDWSKFRTNISWSVGGFLDAGLDIENNLVKSVYFDQNRLKEFYDRIPDNFK